MKTKKLKGNNFYALKLDVMKAFDRLEWSYLKVVMLKLGINPRFMEMVMQCVSSVSFVVMFNGGQLDEFKPTRGIRQGDPISPYLFLLASKGPSCLLKSLDPSEATHGITAAPAAPQVNHLLFVDDSLFFYATPEMAVRLDSLL